MQVGDLVATKHSLKYKPGRLAVGLIIHEIAHHPVDDDSKYVLVQWAGGPTDGVLKSKLEVISKCK